MKGFSLIEMLIVMVVISMLASMVLPVVTEAVAAAKDTQCINNLSQLGKMLEIYRKGFGGDNADLPIELGQAFWLKLTSVGVLETSTPSNPTDQPVLQCPLEGSTATTPDYRGPKINVNVPSNYLNRDPIGGDKINADGTTNHGLADKQGVNTLTKGYSVIKINSTQVDRWAIYQNKTN